MNCPRCGAESQGAYCPRCGAALGAPTVPHPCPHCGTGYFGNFCPTCGAPRYFAPTPIPVIVREPWGWARELFGVGWLIAVFLFLVLMVINLGSLALAAGQIVPGILAQDPGGCVADGQRFECRAHLYLLLPFPMPDGAGGLTLFHSGLRLFGYGFLAWFVVVLWIILTSHIFLAWRDGRLTFLDLRRGAHNLRAPFWSGSSWLTLAQVFALVMFFDETYFFFLRLVGITPQLPSFEGLPNWFLLYNLAFAPVYEELTLRVLYLGLLLGVLMILVASATRSTPGLRLTDYVLGGKFTLNRYSVGPWIFSSVLFALAHVVGGAWAPWKAGDTFVVGLVLGYLFLRRGVAAAILMHFTIDYFAATVIILTGDPNGANLALEIFLGLTVLALSVIGFFFFLQYAWEAYRRFLRAFGLATPRPRPQAVGNGSMPNGPVYQQPSWSPVAYACPRCGAPEARYDAGHLRCTRCGNVT